MTRPTTEAISPFFIVGSVERTVAFYRDKLGFDVMFLEPNSEPFFAIIRRDDACVYAPDPDALAADFAAAGAAFSAPLEDTHDGLRGFEITDPDGYVLFFGRPR